MFINIIDNKEYIIYYEYILKSIYIVNEVNIVSEVDVMKYLLIKLLVMNSYSDC